jgi:hypothetical protein
MPKEKRRESNVRKLWKSHEEVDIEEVDIEEVDIEEVEVCFEAKRLTIRFAISKLKK